MGDLQKRRWNKVMQPKNLNLKLMALCLYNGYFHQIFFSLKVHCICDQFSRANSY